MTTSLRLDKDLRARVSACAAREGKSAHALMVEAVERAVLDSEEAERNRALARTRLARMERTGEAIGFGEMKRWLRDQARGKRAKRPAVVQRGR